MTAWVSWENKSSGQAQMASLVAISETQGFFFSFCICVCEWLNAVPCVCHSSNWATNLGDGFMSLGDLWLGIFFLLRISIHLDRVKVVTGKFVLHRTLKRKFTYNLFPGLWTYLFLKNALLICLPGGHAEERATKKMLTTTMRKRQEEEQRRSVYIFLIKRRNLNTLPIASSCNLG